MIWVYLLAAYALAVTGALVVSRWGLRRARRILDQQDPPFSCRCHDAYLARKEADSDHGTAA